MGDSGVVAMRQRSRKGLLYAIPVPGSRQMAHGFRVLNVTREIKG